ncbi:MAG TPA: hypothetical protein VIK18_13935 [Pirellulales bacterium]
MLGALLTLALGPMAAMVQAQIFGAGPVNGTGIGGFPGPAIPGLYGNYGGTGLYGGYGGTGLYGRYGFPGNHYGPYDYYRAYGNSSGMGYGNRGSAYSRYPYPRHNNSARNSASISSPPHEYKNLFDHNSGNGSAGTGSHAGAQQKSLGHSTMNKAADTP